jgi:spermidine synthase
MTPWHIIDRCELPQRKELQLARRGDEWVLRIGGHTLMSSKAHASEETLAAWALERVVDPKDVLIGGLGLGFTLRAVLDRVSPTTRVIVVELLGRLIAWNRTVVADVAKRPLDDERVRVVQDDVFARIEAALKAYDAILLDVDNGPSATTQASNNRLYGGRGVTACYRALKQGGVLAVWSAGPDETYLRALERARFSVEVKRVTSRGGSKGSTHTLFLATKHAPGRAPPARLAQPNPTPRPRRKK